MTSTEFVVQLDRGVVEALEPACDAGSVRCFCELCKGTVTGIHSCDRPARWVITATCPGRCSHEQVIACHPHHDELMSDGLGLCVTCNGQARYHATPL